MPDTDTPNSRKGLSVANVGFAILGVVVGTFLSPVFSDRMAVERRMVVMEQAIIELRRNCEDSDRMEKQFHADMVGMQTEISGIRELMQQKGKQ